MTAVQAESGAAERQDNDIAAAPAVSQGERALRIVVPAGLLGLVLVAWQVYVTVYNVPHYILPSPIRIAQAMATDWPILVAALIVTLKTTFSALAIALVGGVALAIVMTQSRWLELALFPYAVIL